ncbi:MAG TPA: hypothetical protein VFC21_11855, partial [Bryobacteraceae bacterium]|nr:hypothetical protein [Bryobacteraceae bacterium]
MTEHAAKLDASAVSLARFLKNRITLARLSGALLALFLVLAWTQGATWWVTLLALALAGIGAVVVYRAIRRVLRQSIWRLRNRLILTYVFIGLVPIVLILALTALGTYIVSGQAAVYL